MKAVDGAGGRDEGTPSPLARELALLLDRGLEGLQERIRAYPSEGDLWRTAGSIPNPGGTLAVHLAGNLRHFIGAVLGGTGYVRDREAEFSATPLPRDEILARIREAREVVRSVLAGLDRAALEGAFPGAAPRSLGSEPSTRLMLLHLAGHLSYHLGQVDYHRRMLAGG